MPKIDGERAFKKSPQAHQLPTNQTRNPDKIKEYILHR